MGFHLISQLLLLACTLLIAHFVASLGSRKKGLPPGPRTLPIIGNLHLLPSKHLHITLAEWAKQYGDVVSIKVFHHTIIALNTPSAVKELFDKRSASNSNRPRSITADTITPGDMNLGTGRHTGQTWRVLRRAAVHAVNNDNIKRYSSFQHGEVAQLMWDLAHFPEMWYKHVQRFTASFLMGIVYGSRCPQHSSPDCAAFFDVHPQFLDILEFNKLPAVELFPLLRWVPERWAKWKQNANRIRRLHDDLFGHLLERVERRVENCQETGAFLESAVKHATEWGLDPRELLLNLGGTLLQASDTTSASLQNAIRALVLFPKAQKRLQEELDRVVGPDRVPTLDDIPKLKYTSAFIEESHRFRPAGPLGLPHEMIHDEVINGVLYPKGAIVFMNIWGIFHDPKYFDCPEEFIPERFLKNPLGVKDGILDDPARRINMIFGAGQRVCPGIPFARSSLEIMVASLVWGFDFLPVINPITGSPSLPDPNDYANTVTANPRPFKCHIMPRSDAHLSLIDQNFSASAPVLKQFELELCEKDKLYNSEYRDI